MSLLSNFKPVCSSRLIEIIDKEDTKKDDKKFINERLETIINRHLYCRTIQIISLDENIVNKINNFLINNEELGFLFVKNLPVFSLINSCFIKNFWDKGLLYGLSVGYDVNTEDTIAILPNKQILLSLNTQTYNRLGIIGEQSILNRTKCCTPKYRIIIDLNKPYFKEDKKHYLRIMECLTRTGLSFNVLLKWEPEQSLIDKEISPNSLELYFNYLKEQNNQPIFSNMSVQKAIPTMKLFQNKNQPIISVEKMLNQNLEKEEFVEWFCLQMAQINFNDEELKDSILHDFEDYISVNSCYDIQCVQTMGFFTSFNIKKLIQVLEPENLSQNLNMIMIHGFEDSPQCWSGKNNEHYKNLSGENIYGFSFLNTEKTLIWCLADEYDFGIEKF